MKKHLLIVMAALMMAAMLFAGCSAGSSMEEYYAETEYAMEAPAEKAAMDDGYAEADYEGYDESAAVESEESGSGSFGMESDSSLLEPSVNRKIIYSGYVVSRTKQFDEDYQNVLDQVKEVGGYIESANVYGTKPVDWQDAGRQAELILRVPSTKFDSFVQMLGGLGETVSRSVSGKDISLEYFDAETRLENLRIREERLQALLKEAAGLEDMIELERELDSVGYEIQMYEIELRNYDSLVDFSTITLTLEEVHEIARVTPPDESIGSRISNGFYSVINGLADFGEWLLVFLISALPVLIILGAIAVFVVWIVKRSNKRRIAKQQKKNNVHQQGNQQ